MTLYAISPEFLPIIARACHEANRAYCLALGDPYQMAWEWAPDWQKDAACKGVLGVLCEGDTPEQSHERWTQEKFADGWKWGATKDPEKLEHPCLIPYSELPPEQRAKDHLFRDVCLAMASALRLPEVVVEPIPPSTAAKDSQ